MLSLCIKISSIDYEKTYQQVFPLLKEKISSMESENLIIRLFQKLDDTALPVLLGLMNRLSEATKNGLLVQCLNVYSYKIKEKLNEEMVKNPYGKYLTVGHISIVEQDYILYLHINRVKADYKTLVKEKLKGKLGSVAAFFAVEKLEKLGLELLWTDESKQKLMELVKNTLDKYGFVMNLEDIQLMKDDTILSDDIDYERHLELTDQMETDILDALAGYLKDKTANKDT